MWLHEAFNIACPCNAELILLPLLRKIKMYLASQRWLYQFLLEHLWIVLFSGLLLHNFYTVCDFLFCACVSSVLALAGFWFYFLFPSRSPPKPIQENTILVNFNATTDDFCKPVQKLGWIWGCFVCCFFGRRVLVVVSLGLGLGFFCSGFFFFPDWLNLK